jgi:hypothetical protein
VGEYEAEAGSMLVSPFSNEAISKANKDLIRDKVIKRDRSASGGRVFSLNGL